MIGKTVCLFLGSVVQCFSTLFDLRPLSGLKNWHVPPTHGQDLRRVLYFIYVTMKTWIERSQLDSTHHHIPCLFIYETTSCVINKLTMCLRLLFSKAVDIEDGTYHEIYHISLAIPKLCLE